MKKELKEGSETQIKLE